MTPAQALRVLIVDDEAPARNRIRDLLSDCALKMPIEIAGEARASPFRKVRDAAESCLASVRERAIDGERTRRARIGRARRRSN